MSTTTLKNEKTVNQKIVDAAWESLKAQDLPTEYGWCMMTTRMIVERALSLGDYGFYDAYLEGHAKAEPVVPRSWWARDAHKILRDVHGFGVPASERKAGDLVFNYAVAASKQFPGHNIGHVGILLDRDTVLENGGRGRGVQQFEAIHLTKLSHWCELHQVIRLQAPGASL